MGLKESGEMYLETIYLLSRRGVSVHAVDVGEYMGFSKPSVSRAVGLLKKGGYVIVLPDGSLALTDEGAATAEKIYARHELLTRWLVSIGVSEGTAAEDACRIEHDISDETYIAIKKQLEQ